MFNTFFTIEDDNLICCVNAREYLNFKVESSKLHFIHQVESESGQMSDLIFQSRTNAGLIFFKFISNEVTSDFSITFSGQKHEELEKNATIFFLDSKLSEEVMTDRKIVCPKVVDKNIALLVHFRVPLFSELDRRDLGKLSMTTTFHKSHGMVSRTIEQNLSIDRASYLNIQYNTYADYYNLELTNLTKADISISKIEVSGKNVVSGLELACQESYSLIHDNTAKAPKVPLKIEYSFPPNSIQM
jgi:hypothetical protein